MFRPDRSRNRPVEHLEWRVRLLGAGAILAVVGMYFDEAWLIWVAIGILVVGLLMRFVPGRDADGEETEGT